MGKSKKVTVGFRYYMGIHAVLAVKPIDRLLRWYCQGKVFYNTPASDGTITIDRPRLFSAGEVSDGMRGTINLHLNGTPQFDPYLLAKYPVPSTLVPRFDKWAHIVFAGLTEFNDPELRLDGKFDDADQPTVGGSGFSGQEILDLTTLFTEEELDSGECYIEGKYVRSSSDATVVSVAISVTTYETNDATGISNGTQSDSDGNADSLGSVSIAYSIPPGSRSLLYTAFYQVAIGRTTTLVENYMRIFGPTGVDRGFYIGNQPRPREMFAIGERFETSCPFTTNTTSYTDVDGNTVQDFNILSMYWELFIKNGDNYGSSFAAAADTVASEGIFIYCYGIPPTRSDVEAEISRYVNGRIYTDRGTGLREIKLIRDDFTVGSLVTIGENDIVGEPDITLPHRSAAFNTFEVAFRDREKDYEFSYFTIYDEAHVAAFGVRRSPDPLEYPWITSRSKAIELATRDLRAQTAAGFLGTLKLSGLRTDFNEGTPFVLDLPDYGISTLVCRIENIRENGSRENSVTVAFTEDVFGIEVGPIVVEADLPPPLRSETPLPAAYEVAVEAPYYFAEQVVDIDAKLRTDPGFGGIFSAAAKPGDLHFGYEINVDGFDRTSIDFSPGGELVADVTRTATQITVTPMTALSTGEVIYVSGEWMRVDLIARGVSEWTLNVGRGCIDTAPIAHAAGDAVISSASADSDGEEYTDGIAVTVKHLPFVLGETLDEADATAIPITFNSRAIRPYPPGQFQIEGSYEDQFLSGTVTGTWVSRNRLLQIDDTFAEDHYDDAITEEAGTTYYVRAEAYDFDENLLATFIATDIGNVLTYDYDLTGAPSGTYFVDLSAATIRDGYESFTRPKIRITLGTGAAVSGNERFNDTDASNDTFDDNPSTNDTYDDTE